MWKFAEFDMLPTHDYDSMLDYLIVFIGEVNFVANVTRKNEW